MAQHKIRGDWMTDGYINNLNRRRWLDVNVCQNGDVVLAGADADPMGYKIAIKLDSDGGISAWGASTSFSPDAGEIDRLKSMGARF